MCNGFEGVDSVSTSLPDSGDAHAFGVRVRRKCLVAFVNVHRVRAAVDRHLTDDRRHFAPNSNVGGLEQRRRDRAARARDDVACLKHRGQRQTDANVAPEARHLDHAGLAGHLPSAADLSWLPTNVTVEDDSDLTDRLVNFDCSGTRTDVPSRQPSATNRQYMAGQESLASITFYDIETIDDARAFMSGLNNYSSCPNPPNTTVTIDVVNLNTSA